MNGEEKGHAALAWHGRLFGKSDARPSSRLRSMLAGLASVGLLAGCAITEQPERAYDAAKPSSLPQRTVTNFSEALSCMDDMFLRYGVTDLVITSAGLPDQTGEIRAGTKDMLISSVARMSSKSNAFRFVDYDPMQLDVHELQGLVGFTEDFVVPNYYIRGAVTQLDQGVISESVGGGVALSQVDIGIGKDMVASVISVDMNMGDLLTRQILPGLTSTNSLVIARSGVGGDLGATIENNGVFFNIDMSRSEGVGAAVRTLIELTSIEVLGKLAEVPYWQCLGIDQTDPAIIAEARGWYDGMSTSERVAFTQSNLRSQGQYRGPVDGVMNAELREAISQYQATEGLTADGRITFNLYTSLLGEDLTAGQPPAPVQLEPRVQPAAVQASAPLPAPDIQLAFVDQATFSVGDTVQTRFSLSADGYAYCYYQGADGSVARVFPNQFRPNALVLKGRNVYLPAAEDGFDIIPDTPGVREQLTCIAARTEVGIRLPRAYHSQDLVPLPVNSIDELIRSFESLDPGGVSVATAEIVVR